MTKDEVLEAIRAYFRDTSRDQIETRDGLKDMLIEINDLLDMLPNDGASSKSPRVAESADAEET